MKSGTVALIGRPNAGKSSLVNAILKTRAVIVSPKPQTTRNIIRCIYNDDESQIIFTDTPGLYKITADNDKLGKFFSASVSDFLEDADLICRLVDAGTGKLNNDDAAINEIISLKNISIYEIKNRLMAKGISKNDIEDYISEHIDKLEEYEKKSKEKIIALVPPKKAGVFRSIVNIKLITKASTA